MKKIENIESLNRDFGAYIRRIREEKGYTQGDMATMLDMSQAGYSYLERGERGIDFSTAVRICKILRININSFVKEYM